MSEDDFKVQIALLQRDIEVLKDAHAALEEANDKIGGQIGWGVKIIIGAIILAVLREMGVIQ